MTALVIDRLTRRFGDVVAVDSVSLTVGRGQIYGMLGPNGSGKSTTLACALGLMRPTSGRIELLGEPARQIHRTRGRVAAVFDEPMKVRGLTVRQQLKYARTLRGHAGGRSIDEALELTGCRALAKRGMTQLSLGQCKRVAIAAALGGCPELLVLDEPLSGLDPVGVRDLLETLRSLAQADVTIVLSSHRLHELEALVSHVAILLGGRLACEGALADLLGSRTRHELLVSDVGRARVVLGGLPGVDVLADTAEASAGAHGQLMVDASEHTPGALNQVLVEAGVLVHGLRPVEVSLPALFDDLVAGHTGGRTRGSS
ncbi:MAG: ABC-2 type transport system ATP-binding protein [Chlamydiales bacterium]|jgi:ABC-2 type transport system ATP-binding protein